VSRISARADARKFSSATERAWRAVSTRSFRLPPRSMVKSVRRLTSVGPPAFISSNCVPNTSRWSAPELTTGFDRKPAVTILAAAMAMLARSASRPRLLASISATASSTVSEARGWLAPNAAAFKSMNAAVGKPNTRI